MTDNDLNAIRRRLDLMADALAEMLPPDAARRFQEDWIGADGLEWDETTGRWFRPEGANQ